MSAFGLIYPKRVESILVDYNIKILWSLTTRVRSPGVQLDLKLRQYDHALRSDDTVYNSISGCITAVERVQKKGKEK